jgi:hypothetical protein
VPDHHWPPGEGWPSDDLAPRVQLDEAGALRAWFRPAGVPLATSRIAAREAARALLRLAAARLGGPVPVDALRDGPTVEGPRAFSVGFFQEFKGLPVDASEVLVNFHGDGRVHSVYSHVHDDIPAALDPARIRLGAVDARQAVARLARVYRRRRIGRPRLLVYRFSGIERHPPKPPRRRAVHRARFLAAARRRRIDAPVGRHFIAWDVALAAERPRHRWRVLIDAVSGRVIEVLDQRAYATGTGKVFDPNPLVTSGDPGLSKSSSPTTVNAERVQVSLERLAPKDSEGYLRLDGAWVHMEEFDDPEYAEPSKKNGRFVFSWTNRKFLSVMAYFHIDRFQQYLQAPADLDMPGIGDFSVPADPQGQSGGDVSGQTAEGVSFGEGGVPDATDAMIVLHEYGHVIQGAIRPGSSHGNWGSGVSEGFGDFLAAAYYDDKHTNPAATRGHMFSWDANPTDAYWTGRRYDRPWRFDGPEYTPPNQPSPDGYQRGEIWCSTLFELYRKLGGDSATAATRAAARDLAIRLHVAGLVGLPGTEATATEMAQQIEAADHDLGGWRYPNGLHGKLIYDTFARRGLPGYPPLLVDVYVDDGRNGGYGSLSGQDLFNEKLWLEPFDQAPDVWTTAAQYPAVNQAAGTPVDHVAQQAGAQAFIYARVKNRGTDPAGAGPVTVRAFHAAATGDWPGAWTPADVASIPYANVPAGGSIVAGPFPFTPASASPSLLVVVECARDRTLTQDLPAGTAARAADLVPFDNNIALRRLV